MSVSVLAGLIVLLLLLELVAPPSVPLGALVLVVVSVGALVLDRRRALFVVGLAVASRAAVAAVGDISIALAALECASFCVAAAVTLAIRGAGRLSDVRDPVVPQTLQIPRAVPEHLSENGLLTEREHEVIEMAMQGLTAAQVAARLFISRRTVETHLEHAYAKLGVKSKRELIASAFDQARSAQGE